VKTGIFLALDAATGKVTPYPHTGLDLASERERGYAQRPERVMWIDGRLAVFARVTDDPNSRPRLTYRDVTSRGLNADPGKADWFLLDAKGRNENLTKQLKTISAVPVHATAKSLFVLADGNVWRLQSGKSPVNLTSGVGAEFRYPDTVLYTQKRPPFTGFATFISQSDGKSRFTLVDVRAAEPKISTVESPSEDSRFMAGSAVSGAVMFRKMPATARISFEPRKRR